MTNSFALNHDKSLQIYFFCVKRQAKNDFLKDVKSTVDSSTMSLMSIHVTGKPETSLFITGSGSFQPGSSVLALREVWESETLQNCLGTSKNQCQEV